MPNLSNGNYNIVTNASAAGLAAGYGFGQLVVSGPPNNQTATFKLNGQTTSSAVSGLNTTCGSIGWSVTVGNVTYTYSNGSCGTSNQITGGSLSAGTNTLTWATAILGIPYNVTLNGDSANAGDGVLSVSSDNTSATYTFTGTTTAVAVSKWNPVTGSIGWQVANASGTTYTFGTGAYTPPGSGSKAQISSGTWSTKTGLGQKPAEEDETWTAEAQTTGEAMEYRTAAAT